MMKTFGNLALYAAVFEFIVLVVVGPQGGWPIGADGRVVVSTLIATLLAGAAFFFAVGALGAGIVALATRKTPADEPGLKTGTTLMVLVVLLTVFGQISLQSQ
jgi:hypothetical protein